MAINNEKELELLAFLVEWGNKTPEDRKGIQSQHYYKQNTQTTRLSFVLNLIVANNKKFNDVYKQIERLTTRAKDGNSYFSKDSSWMKEPYHIKEGWYFEGCTSLVQKQRCIQKLTNIKFLSGFRFSGIFSDCLCDFIADSNLSKYIPIEDEGDNCPYQKRLAKVKLLEIDRFLSIIS